jgi:tetratricopeptide (TPR) repeat protein
MTTPPPSDGVDEPMNSPEYSHFVALTEAERFSEAEALATSMFNPTVPDGAFWKAQLGYACFLNERDAEHFDRALDHFEELVAWRPHDPNARFWKSYVELIAREAYDSGREELQALARMAPDHPYAFVVLGGIPGEASEVIRYLEASLRIVPNNFRALRELGKHLDRSGRRDEARRVFSTLIESEPFIETRYGVMNSYMNGVLNGAAHADAWKGEARRYLAASGD